MPKNDAVDRRRSALSAARDAPESAASRELLRGGLRDRVQIVVARAAKIVGELELGELAPELEAAFRRLLVDPSKRDKGCLGKSAIVEALVRLEHGDAEVFLSAARHRQHEPVWGGTVDTAAQLRGLAGEGLVICRHPDVMNVLVDLLADEEKPARLGAIRALARVGGDGGALLLRLKTHHGDPDIEVVAECFSAVVAVGPPVPAIEFLARFLDAADPAVAEVAALALGESRHDDAFEALKSRWESSGSAFADGELRRVLLASLALLRSEGAKTFLLALLASEQASTAEGALSALGPFLYDPDLRRRVEEIVRERGERSLTELLKTFG